MPISAFGRDKIANFFAQASFLLTGLPSLVPNEFAFYTFRQRMERIPPPPVQQLCTLLGDKEIAVCSRRPSTATAGKWFNNLVTAQKSLPTPFVWLLKKSKLL